MKRMLLHPACWYSIRRVVVSPSMGEHHKAVHGISRSIYKCDDCGEPIHHRSEAVAVSLWTDELERAGRGYRPWETEYLGSV